jgi:hypothetical protein
MLDPDLDRTQHNECGSAFRNRDINQELSAKIPFKNSMG